MSICENRFSIPHRDMEEDPNKFLESFEKSSEQYKKEIADIYFGGNFVHRDVSLTNVMGVQPSKAQYKNLLKIQDKYGIILTLCLNDMNRSFRMLRKDVLNDFIEYIKGFYDDGVRSCAISHTHLMNLGVLQNEFPDMLWRNTVNHEVRTAQDLHNYAALGYNIIQLDRSLNRDLKELKKISIEAKKLNVKTSLLIMESCMPNCVFKREHDSWQNSSIFRDLDKTYWDLLDTCQRWRNEDLFWDKNPRLSTNCMLNTNSDWDEYSNLVDYFKKSGRLFPVGKYNSSLASKFVHRVPETRDHVILEVPDFTTAYENNIEPLSFLLSGNTDDVLTPIKDIDEIKDVLKAHFMNTKKYKVLKDKLKDCKNECYSCHMCDKFFMDKEFNSILELYK